MKKRFFKKTLYLFLYIGALSICKYPSFSDITLLKLGYSQNMQEVDEVLEHMTEVVKEKSSGLLQIEIFSTQQDSEGDCLKLLKNGRVALAKVSTHSLENFDCNGELANTSYIYKDQEYAFRVHDGGISKVQLHQENDYWLRGLAYFDNGSLSSNTSVVNAFPLSISTSYPSREEDCKPTLCMYPKLNNNTSGPELLLIGTDIWDGLSEQEQEWLQEAADEAVNFQRQANHQRMFSADNRKYKNTAHL